MDNKQRTAFFIGPTPGKLLGCKRDPYRELVDGVSDYVIELAAGRGINRYVTGGFQGFEQLAFWAVEKAKRKDPQLGIKNFLLLPYAGQADAWEEQGAFGRTDYARMLRHCDDSTTLETARPADEKAVSAMLVQRNSVMLGISNICICLWPAGNDKWMSARTRGDIADTLRKALMRGKEIYLLRYVIANEKVMLCSIDCVSQGSYARS